jgi:hypothetical protein
VLQSQRRYRNFVMLNLTKLLLAWCFRALSAVTQRRRRRDLQSPKDCDGAREASCCRLRVYQDAWCSAEPPPPPRIRRAPRSNACAQK